MKIAGLFIFTFSGMASICLVISLVMRLCNKTGSGQMALFGLACLVVVVVLFCALWVIEGKEKV